MGIQVRTSIQKEVSRTQITQNSMNNASTKAAKHGCSMSRIRLNKLQHSLWKWAAP